MEHPSIETPNGEPTQLINGGAKAVKKPHVEAKRKAAAVIETPTGTTSVRVDVSKALLEKFADYHKARGPISAEELEEKAKSKGAAAFERTLTDAMQSDEPFQKYLAKKK